MEEGRKNDTDLPLTDGLPADVAELRDAAFAISAATARALRAVSRCAQNRRFEEAGFRSMTDWLSSVFAIGWRTAKAWGVRLEEAE